MIARMPEDERFGQGVTFAKDQPEYFGLPARVSNEYGGCVTTEWEPTAEELARLMAGARVRFRFLTFGRPLQPIIQEIGGVSEVVAVPVSRIGPAGPSAPPRPPNHRPVG